MEFNKSVAVGSISNVKFSNLPQVISPALNLIKRIWSVAKFIFGIVFPCLREQRTVYLYHQTEDNRLEGEAFLKSHCPWRYRLNIISTTKNSDTSGPGKRVLAIRNPTSSACQEWLSGSGFDTALKLGSNRKVLFLINCPLKSKPCFPANSHGWTEICKEGLIVYNDFGRTQTTNNFYD